MEFEVVLKLKVDKDADFLDTTRSNNTACLQELLEDIIYDFSDLELIEATVEQLKD